MAPSTTALVGPTPTPTTSGSSRNSAAMPPVVAGPSLIVIHEGLTNIREALARVAIPAAEGAEGAGAGASERERQLQREAAWAELRYVCMEIGPPASR